MDVRVDETRGDETACVIVDERACGSAGKNVGRFSDRLDQAAVNEHGSILDERIGARAALGRIVAERENAATNDASDGQVRISFSLSAAIRSISASAVFVSASASLARRSRKAARMSSCAFAFDRHDEGKAEPRAIGVVELAENWRSSSGVSRSSPALACSRVNSAVSVLARASLPARSGWASISARFCSFVPFAAASASAFASPSAVSAPRR